MDYLSWETDFSSKYFYSCITTWFYYTNFDSRPPIKQCFVYLGELKKKNKKSK